MPVIRSFTQHLSFAASHKLPGHSQCERMHGHSYRVSLTWHGAPVGDYGYPAEDQVRSAASGIVLELGNRHLNDMLPAGIPSVSGIAAYLLERTQMLGVSKVEVHESDTNAEGAAEYIDR